MFFVFIEEGIDDDFVWIEGGLINDYNKRWLFEKMKRKKN